MIKEDFFSKLGNDYPDDTEIERTKHVKNGEHLTTLHKETDIILLTDVLEKVIKVSIKKFGRNPLYCVSALGYSYKCALKYTDIKLQTLQDKELILLLENNTRRAISCIMRGKYVILKCKQKDIIY